jgi:hypothetical protein
MLYVTKGTVMCIQCNTETDLIMCVCTCRQEARIGAKTGGGGVVESFVEN